MSEIYTLHRGHAPLLVSVPHAGTAVPDDIACRLSEEAKPLADTDWHVHTLYDFAASLGASVLVAHYSRYVVDLNRPPDNESLYPGQTTTGLIPIDTFDGNPVYQNDVDPDLSEVVGRVDGFWRPYHSALQTELDRIKAEHGHAVLWDAHSIASKVPRLFDGHLPDFNLGTNGGKSCAEDLADAVYAKAQSAEGYTSVLNGRFKGGYITRHYGKPQDGIHALQLELSQATYMQESAPWPFRIDLANKVRPHLREMLETCLAWKAGA
ncbi:N-formylglutamate deformylase [Rhodospirillaceae bacterium KN72]|uniref:N-formylglutamate deformylase n=1 Tax=Pacificispira spongiicola TaxID=2729598 RepID=A0A7Y0DZ97_9PROT|nr:N-formylglutamate deformylase [Pacificispira spongiicola]NMM44338.1 N-formylglutamate deformylase [Pacificispira spongiicola]